MANELTALALKISTLARSEKVMRAALSTVLAAHKPRIFKDGLDANGAQIGVYSTKPTSVARSQQARNTGKTYFKGGYAEYKTAVGKNPGKVILRNKDQMMSDYGIVIGSGSFAFGFQNAFNYDKSQWMETKYKKDIFALSNTEVDILGNVIVQQLNALI